MASPQIKVTLTSACADSGPCDLYVDSDGYVTPVVTGISIAVLTGFGYYLASVPTGTTTIRIQNTGTCTNYEDVVIQF